VRPSGIAPIPKECILIVDENRDGQYMREIIASCSNLRVRFTAVICRGESVGSFTNVYVGRDGGQGAGVAGERSIDRWIDLVITSGIPGHIERESLSKHGDNNKESVR
jgi:hypothetical protein